MATQSKARPKGKAQELAPLYGIEQPFTLTVQLRGTTPFLFNKFADLDGYAEARVASKRKPREEEIRDYEQSVWRNDDGELVVPNENVIASIISAARYYKSPISGQGGATRTLRDAIVAEADSYASFGVKEWDCIDFRLCRNSDIKRSPKPTWRPRLERGWVLTAHLGVIVPELYGPAKLLEIIARAGQVAGIGDGRKIGFGRYVTVGSDHAEGLPW